MEEVFIEGTDLTNAVVSHADFINSDITFVNFSGADLHLQISLMHICTITYLITMRNLEAQNLSEQISPQLISQDLIFLVCTLMM